MQNYPKQPNKYYSGGLLWVSRATDFEYVAATPAVGGGGIHWGWGSLSRAIGFGSEAAQVKSGDLYVEGLGPQILDLVSDLFDLMANWGPTYLGATLLGAHWGSIGGLLWGSISLGLLVLDLRLHWGPIYWAPIGVYSVLGGYSLGPPI